jgi:hypothetical protein
MVSDATCEEERILEMKRDVSMRAQENVERVMHSFLNSRAIEFL